MSKELKESSKIKNKQLKTIMIIGGSLFLIFLIFSFFNSSSGKPSIKKESTTKKISFEKTNSIKAEDKWMYDQGNKIDTILKELEDQKKEKEELKQQITDLNQSILTLKESNDKQDQSNELELTPSQQQRPQQAGFGPPITSPNFNNNPDNTNSNDSNTNSNTIVNNRPRKINTFTINLIPHDPNIELNKVFYKQTKDYVAQGSYAQGILISSVEASVGISSMEDPRPVLIRVTGDAISASLKNKKERTNIKGCLITAGAIADLSSERVYVKLSKMTCSRKKGEVFEVPVKGYASGLGKAGIRGVVVSREWDKLSTAFFAGLLGGFGSSYAESLKPPAALTAAGTVITQKQSIGNALKSGFGGGIKSSSDTISDYMMKRAEQYQPVVSIPAGIEIEVVFIDGFHLKPQGSPSANTTATATVNNNSDSNSNIQGNGNNNGNSSNSGDSYGVGWSYNKTHNTNTANTSNNDISSNLRAL